MTLTRFLDSAQNLRRECLLAGVRACVRAGEAATFGCAAGALAGRPRRVRRRCEQLAGLMPSAAAAAAAACVVA
jgi:hypothetical protein